MKQNPEEKRKPGRPKKSTEKTPVSSVQGARKPTRVKPTVSKFEEILKIADHELRNYLRTLDTEIIFAALQGADESVKDKVLSNITKRSLLKYEILAETYPEKYNSRQINTARKELIQPYIKRSTK
jgi:flagellar motor switch protein FliG